MANVESEYQAGDIRLLVADADSAVREIVRYCAREEGWECDDARDGISALKLLRRKEYHLIVLENELPEIDGSLVCSQVRKSSRAPVIFISRKATEDDRLAGFAAGGNDYVVKPFFPRELVARAKSLLDLSGVADNARQVLITGHVHVDLSSHLVLIDGRQIALTPREYDLLIFFCQNPNKAFSRDAILDLVWGEQFFGTDRTVDTHVKSLRNKIRPYHNYIVTIWGYGYKLEI